MAQACLSFLLFGDFLSDVFLVISTGVFFDGLLLILILPLFVMPAAWYLVMALFFGECRFYHLRDP